MEVVDPRHERLYIQSHELNDAEAAATSVQAISSAMPLEPSDRHRYIWIRFLGVVSDIVFLVVFVCSHRSRNPARRGFSPAKGI